MRGSKAKTIVAKWICELLATHEFVAFTRTPKQGAEKKELRMHHENAKENFTIKHKEKTYER